MTLIKMIKFFPNSEGKHEGDIFEYPDPTTVLKEGLAEEVLMEVPVIKKEVVTEKVKKIFKKGKKS